MSWLFCLDKHILTDRQHDYFILLRTCTAQDKKFFVPLKNTIIYSTQMAIHEFIFNGSECLLSLTFITV